MGIESLTVFQEGKFILAATKGPCIEIFSIEDREFLAAPRYNFEDGDITKGILMDFSQNIYIPGVNKLTVLD